MVERIVRCALAISFVVLVTGCPRPVGECRYGEAGGESWTGTITQLDVLEDAQGDVYVIRVEGENENPQEFRLFEDVYESCIASHGYEVGSEVEVVIQYGGPCPPQRRLGFLREH